ncbi:hypothetical protein GR268_43720 [Rhizobium leguminosarum]|nr:hypothetical protein [Rhizobium leguminosarum]
MFWKRKAKSEWLPWYRAPGYKGNLTEAQKRQLDSFRTQDRHPAASYSDLPDEVQSYISRLELENYDFKQGKAAGATLVGSAFGALMLGASYFGVNIPPANSIWSYVIAILFLIVPWFHYSWQWKRNADEFQPRGGPRPVDEHIKQEWELAYLERLYLQERHSQEG